MLTSELREYIDKHKLCADYIFPNWMEFLDLLYTHSSCVKEILWFEHIATKKQADSLGCGGYIDPTNPEYMYAETYIHEKGMENNSLSEVKAYIKSVISSYPNNHLVPSFMISE